ncbi:MAG: hypothetical protein MRY63_02595 [Neomegalonema sp.]|nr:hypothetical protein [Neomegalonema sp.]
MLQMPMGGQEEPLFYEVDPELDTVPLHWRREEGLATFPEALSPLIVAAIAGRNIKYVTNATPVERMTAIGTLGSNVSQGTVHVWGAGFVGSPETRMQTPRGFVPPSGTQYAIYALRGPFSSAMMRVNGIETQPIYGDAAWFAPKVLPFDQSEKSYELGVVVQRAADAERTLTDGTVLRRYGIGRDYASDVTLIELDCAPTLSALRAKAREIGACRRIISNCPQIMPVIEALGIPCASFAPGYSGSERSSIFDDDGLIPDRIRDFYAGIGAGTALLYRQKLDEATDWDMVIAGIDANWMPSEYDPAAFFNEFPMPTQVALDAPRWPLPASIQALTLQKSQGLY